MPQQKSYSPWLGAVIPLLALAFWEYEGLVGALPRYLPPPSAVGRELIAMLASGELFVHIGASLFRALSGFAIGAFCGWLAGLLAGALRPVERFYEPIISLTYPVPKIAALPIVFAWFGLGNLSKIVIITVSVFYPLYIATVAGAKATPRAYIWAARNMGAPKLTIIMRVLSAAALPQIFNGLRIGLALSFVVMFVAEMVSSSEGLGYLIVFADQNERFDLVYVAIVSIGVIGFMADRVLLLIRNRLLVGQLMATEFGSMSALKPVLRFFGRYYSVFVLLAAYEAMSRLGLVSQRLFPSLGVIAQQLWIYTANGQLIYQAGISLERAVVGFALALAVGVSLGTAMARSRFIEALIDPLFVFSYPIPKIALYPVFIFVFGLGDASKIALVFLECLYPIVIHVHAGMRSADRVLIWAARNMGASRAQVFTRVLVPASLPIVFTGLRIALPVSLIITLVTEIIGESRGLGFFVTFATSSFQYGRALAAFFVIALLGFVLDRALLLARDRIVFWQRSDAEV